jgi:serine/threonine protein kinase
VPEQPAQRFQVKHKVATGQTVVVARALDRETGRDVAIKTLLDDHASYPDRVAYFSTASKLAARVLHLNLVPVIAARRQGTRIFTVSPWASGTKLAELPMPMAPATVAGVATQLAEAMAVAHAGGTILRGLSPLDILLRPDGQVLLLDLNKLQTPGPAGPLPPPTSRAAVLRYQPMEARSNGLIDGQTDIFCLGALMLELLTGVPPTREGALDMKPALVKALTAPGTLGAMAKIAMTLAAPRADQRPDSVANLPGSLEEFWATEGHGSAKGAVAAGMAPHVPGVVVPHAAPGVVPGDPFPASSPLSSSAPDDPPEPGGQVLGLPSFDQPAPGPVHAPQVPHPPAPVPMPPVGPERAAMGVHVSRPLARGGGVTVDVLGPAAPAPGSGVAGVTAAVGSTPHAAAGRAPPRPVTARPTPLAMPVPAPGRTVPRPGTGRVPAVARVATPSVAPPAPQPIPDEVELNELFEETTTELERLKVKEAISGGEVLPPTSDPWGMRSEGRFRSLDGGGFAEAPANASGFAYVDESGVTRMGPPAPGGRTGNTPKPAVAPRQAKPAPAPLEIDLDLSEFDGTPPPQMQPKKR